MYTQMLTYLCLYVRACYMHINIDACVCACVRQCVYTVQVRTHSGTHAPLYSRHELQM